MAGVTEGDRVTLRGAGLSASRDGLAPLYQIRDLRMAYQYYRMQLEVRLAEGLSMSEAMAAQRHGLGERFEQVPPRTRAVLEACFPLDLFEGIFRDAKRVRLREALDDAVESAPGPL